MWWTDFCNQYFSVGVLPCSHNWLRASVCAPPFLDEMKMMRTAATTLQDVRALRSFPGIHSLSKCFSLQFIVEGFDSGFLKYCWWVVGDVVANCPVGQNRSDSHTWGWWLVVALVALPSQRALGVVITLMEQQIKFAGWTQRSQHTNTAIKKQLIQQTVKSTYLQYSNWVGEN